MTYDGVSSRRGFQKLCKHPYKQYLTNDYYRPAYHTVESKIKRHRNSTSVSLHSSPRYDITNNASDRRDLAVARLLLRQASA